jgi:type I restriction enzyme R subunit
MTCWYLKSKSEAGFRNKNYLLFRNIDAKKKRPFDVLEYVFNSEIKPITLRETQQTFSVTNLLALLNSKKRIYRFF